MKEVLKSFLVCSLCLLALVQLLQASSVFDPLWLENSSSSSSACPEIIEIITGTDANGNPPAEPFNNLLCSVNGNEECIHNVTCTFITVILTSVDYAGDDIVIEWEPSNPVRPVITDQTTYYATETVEGCYPEEHFYTCKVRCNGVVVDQETVRLTYFPETDFEFIKDDFCKYRIVAPDCDEAPVNLGVDIIDTEILGDSGTIDVEYVLPGHPCPNSSFNFDLEPCCKDCPTAEREDKWASRWYCEQTAYDFPFSDFRNNIDDPCNNAFGDIFFLDTPVFDPNAPHLTPWDIEIDDDICVDFQTFDLYPYIMCIDKTTGIRLGRFELNLYQKPGQNGVQIKADADCNYLSVGECPEHEYTYTPALDQLNPDSGGSVQVTVTNFGDVQQGEQQCMQLNQSFVIPYQPCTPEPDPPPCPSISEWPKSESLCSGASFTLSALLNDDGNQLERVEWERWHNDQQVVISNSLETTVSEVVTGCDPIAYNYVLKVYCLQDTEPIAESDFITLTFYPMPEVIVESSDLGCTLNASLAENCADFEFTTPTTITDDEMDGGSFTFTAINMAIPGDDQCEDSDVGFLACVDCPEITKIVGNEVTSVCAGTDVEFTALYINDQIVDRFEWLLDGQFYSEAESIQIDNVQAGDCESAVSNITFNIYCTKFPDTPVDSHSFDLTVFPPIQIEIVPTNEGCGAQAIANCEDYQIEYSIQSNGPSDSNGTFISSDTFEGGLNGESGVLNFRVLPPDEDNRPASCRRLEGVSYSFACDPACATYEPVNYSEIIHLCSGDALLLENEFTGFNITSDENGTTESTNGQLVWFYSPTDSSDPETGTLYTPGEALVLDDPCQAKDFELFAFLPCDFYNDGFNNGVDGDSYLPAGSIMARVHPEIILSENLSEDNCSVQVETACENHQISYLVASDGINNGMNGEGGSFSNLAPEERGALIFTVIDANEPERPQSADLASCFLNQFERPFYCSKNCATVENPVSDKAISLCQNDLPNLEGPLATLLLNDPDNTAAEVEWFYNLTDPNDPGSGIPYHPVGFNFSFENSCQAQSIIFSAFLQCDKDLNGFDENSAIDSYLPAGQFELLFFPDIILNVDYNTDQCTVELIDDCNFDIRYSITSDGINNELSANGAFFTPDHGESGEITFMVYDEARANIPEACKWASISQTFTCSAICPQVSQATGKQQICNGDFPDLSDGATGFVITEDYNKTALQLVWFDGSRPDRSNRVTTSANLYNGGCDVQTFEIHAFLQCDKDENSIFNPNIGADQFIPAGSLFIDVLPDLYFEQSEDCSLELVDNCSNNSIVIEYDDGSGSWLATPPPYPEDNDELHYRIYHQDAPTCGEQSVLIANCALEAPPVLHFPTAFSPNTDGLNDAFKPANELLLTEYQLKVFNRWGQEIFSSSDPGNGWNGTFKGRQQAVGNYLFVVQYRLEGRSAVVSDKGYIMLVR